MRPKYVKVLLSRELKKIESQLISAFKSGNERAITRLVYEFADKAQEYQDFVDSLK